MGGELSAINGKNSPNSPMVLARIDCEEVDYCNGDEGTEKQANSPGELSRRIIYLGEIRGRFFLIMIRWPPRSSQRARCVVALCAPAARRRRRYHRRATSKTSPPPSKVSQR